MTESPLHPAEMEALDCFYQQPLERSQKIKLNPLHTT
jgi:hypothetical protein